MKILSVIFLAVVLAACSRTVDPITELDDIREATFRYQFAKNASGQQQNAKVYFLALEDSGKKESGDPSDSFMARFSGHHPRIAKQSAAVSSPHAGVSDKKTGESGLIFRIWKIRRVGEDAAEVDGGYYEAGLSASGNTYFLKKKWGKWIVERDVMHWISQRRPNQPLPATRFARG